MTVTSNEITLAQFIHFARRFAIAFEYRMISSEDKKMLTTFQEYLDKLDKMYLISASELNWYRKKIAVFVSLEKSHRWIGGPHNG